MTDREVMQQALDALESVFEGDDKGAEYWTVTGGTYEAVECMQAMRALRAQLAQPETNPVAQVQVAEDYHAHVIWTEGVNPVDLDQKYLYVAPPQREPYAAQAAMVSSQTQGRMSIDPVTGDVSIG